MLHASRDDRSAAYHRAWCADPGELDVAVDGSALDGTLPDELVGATVWMNGPAGLARHGWIQHPFDGHGYVRALRLDRGRARLQARFVRTPAYEAEEDAGRMIHRGLGTLVPGGAFANLRAPQRRHVANTCVLPWNGAVLALWEGGLPYRLDPDTLATLGPETFGGALAPSSAFLAHTRFDARTNRLIGVTQNISGLRTVWEIFEIDSAGGVVARRAVSHDRPSVTHDFLITERYYVFLENAVTLDLVGAMRARLGLGPLLGAIRHRVVPGRVVLVPRDGGPVRVATLDRPLFTVHHVNAWDEHDGVEILTCGFPRFRFGGELGYRGPRQSFDATGRGPEGAERVLRVSIRGDRGELRELSRYAIDFPRAHPLGDGQRTTHAWGATCSRTGCPDPFDAVAHLDLERQRTTVWRAGDSRFVGEPLVVPRAGARAQDEAWIVAMIYDGIGETTTLVVLDGADLAAGPRATLRLPARLPYGFHGWVEPPH